MCDKRHAYLWDGQFPDGDAAHNHDESSQSGLARSSHHQPWRTVSSPVPTPSTNIPRPGPAPTPADGALPTARRICEARAARRAVKLDGGLFRGLLLTEPGSQCRVGTLWGFRRAGLYLVE